MKKNSKKRQHKVIYQTTKRQFTTDYFTQKGEENPIPLKRFLKDCQKEGVLKPHASIKNARDLIYPARRHMEKEDKKTIILVHKKTYQFANGFTDNYGETRKRGKRIIGADNSRSSVAKTIDIKKFLPETQSMIQKYINRIEIASENIKFNQQKIDQAVAKIKQIEKRDTKQIS